MSTGNNNASSSEFYVRSGAVCFGWPHNAEYGASQPIQTPSLLAFELGGTVLVTSGLHHNFAAVNGKWRAFKITKANGSATSAFFCCHESVSDPVAELKRINRKAGSPYEQDSGDSKNTQATFENRIIVINRYDWSYYDKRNYEHDSELHIKPNSQGSYCVLVDYAKTVQALRGENLSGDDRDLVGLRNTSNSNSSDEFVGVRLFLNNNEYEFGRFGLNETRTAVESFLFFSADTEFDKCKLNGEPVKITRSIDQIVVEDGLACDSFEIFTSYKVEAVNGKHIRVPEETKPPAGPLKQFGDDLSIISVEEANAFLSRVCAQSYRSLGQDKTPQIKPPFEHKVIRLLNECLLTFLSTITDALSPVQTVEQAEERFHQLVQTVYGKTSQSKLKVLIGEFLRKEKDPLPSIGVEMENRTKSFVEQQIGVTLSASTLSSVQSAMSFVAQEVLELVCRNALDSSRTLVTPGDARKAIFFDKELLELFQSCRLFWPPASAETTSTPTTATSST